jgi:purine-binding chemotaxis protein CheW
MDLVEIRKKAKKAEKKKKDRKPGKDKPKGKSKVKSREKAKEKSRDKPEVVAEEHVKEVHEIKGHDEGEIHEDKGPALAEAEAVVESGPSHPATVEEAPEMVYEDELASLKDVLKSQHDADREEEEEENIQVLTFMLAGEEYGLNIMEIKEIVRPKEPTEVPRTPDFVLGIISLRGMIIPIYDVSERLGLSGGERDQKSRVIVVKHREHFYGLLVDAVIQVIDIPLSRIEPPPEIVSGVEGEFLRGIGKIDDRLIILLNLTRILSVEDSSPSASGESLTTPAEPSGNG